MYEDYLYYLLKFLSELDLLVIVIFLSMILFYTPEHFKNFCAYIFSSTRIFNKDSLCCCIAHEMKIKITLRIQKL